jgi:hypothetical protein
MDESQRAAARAKVMELRATVIKTAEDMIVVAENLNMGAAHVRAIRDNLRVQLEAIDHLLESLASA